MRQGDRRQGEAISVGGHRKTKTLGAGHREYLAAFAAHALRAVAVFVFVLVIGIGDAKADDDAGAFVQDIGNKVIGLIKRDDLSRPERDEGFRRLFIAHIELKVVSRAALGRYRKLATEAQFARYQAIYPDYVLEVYGGLFASYKGETLTIVSSTPMRGGDVLVSGEVERPEAPIVKIAFRVRKIDDRFKILDVMVEGISLLVTQRSEFAAVIQREGMDGFLERIGKVAHRNSSGL